MGKQFDERVEYAINQLWVNPYEGDGAKAKAMLEEAANEGDGDACFFLGRCYLGECFISPLFGFEEDAKKGKEYFNKSIELGSAVGMFGTQRLAGFKPACGSFIHAPYNSSKEVWDAVVELADNGQVFCQYMLGNAFYYGDCIEMLQIPEEKVTPDLIHNFQLEAAKLFEQCIAQGLSLGIGNLIDILSSGDFGVKKDEKRVKELIKRGAELHSPYYECEYANSLEDRDFEKALQLYEDSIRHGGSNAYYYLGKIYSKGTKVKRDIHKAIDCFEKGIAADANWTGCTNLLGEIYFYGKDDVAPDYDKAFSLLVQANEENDWGASMLGHCYLKGLGTPVNYEAAFKLFNIYPAQELAAIGLGEMYCFGLGVEKKINTGMNHLSRFPNNPRVKEIKSHFKRTLFGWKEV